MKHCVGAFYLVCLLCLSAFQVQAQSTVLHEDFSSCTGSLPTGWTKYSVSGNENWSCSNAGMSGNGVMMSGYSNGNNNQNEDWLISPTLDFSAYLAPYVDFWCRTNFNGQFLQVMVSTNYAGSGNPNAATWTALPVVLPAVNSNTWTYAGPLNLSAYKNQPMHLAFKYVSNTSAAASWWLDGVEVSDGALSLSRKFLNAGQCGMGSTSVVSSFSWTMSNLSGPMEIQAPAPFEVSKDGISFATTLSYSTASAGIPQTTYVRVAPQQSEKVYRKSLRFFYNGHHLNQELQLLGTSLPDDKTLRVLNWNMRWFGDPSFCACDTTLAKNNAIQLMKDIQADVYCLQEVVSVYQLAQVCAALGPAYSYAVSPFGSGAPTVNSPNYTGAQKLAFIYNSQKLSNAGTFGLLASTYPADTTAYACFSSGRFPFVMKAALHLQGGGSDTLVLANIHGKAGSTLSDYNRRLCATQAMTDSLNTLFPGKKVLVLGDFNDYLEGSSVAGQAVSPYQYLLSQGFQGITLPSVFAGQSTYVGSSSHMIDHVVTSSALWSAYPDSSCFIFTEAERFLSAYGSTTSDHFPVMSYYRFTFPNGVKDWTGVNGQRVFSLLNPSDGTLSLHGNRSQDPVDLTLYDLSGRQVGRKRVALSSGEYHGYWAGLVPGLYFLQIRQGTLTQLEKWIIR